MKRHAGRDSVAPGLSRSDAVFLLIVFLLACTAFAIEGALSPGPTGVSSVVARIAPRSAIRVDVMAGGAVTVDGSPTDPSGVGLELGRAVAASPDAVVVVESHAGASYDLIVNVIDQVKQAGASRISLRPADLQ